MVGTDLEARIKERAYQIWEREGRPDGRHLDHWRRAEQEIEAQAGQGVLKRSIETPNPAPEMQPSAPAAERSPGAARRPGAKRATPAEAATGADAAKRTVKRKQTQSEAKSPRTRRPRTATPKSTG